MRVNCDQGFSFVKDGAMSMIIITKME